jgi:SAM-dependent methyltransferase
MNELLRKFQQRDIELMEKLDSTPFYAGFWNRQRIDKALKSAASEAHGILLDIGCGSKPYRNIFAPFVEKHIGLEYSPESGYRKNAADFCGDAMILPLGDETVDTILCTEVLEHLPHPEKAIAEFARVLRPNGTIITTAPFFFPIHDAWDFYRYTHDGIATMMKSNDLKIVKVEPLSGTAVTLALLFNLYWFDIGFMWTKWLYPFGVVLRPVLLLLCFIVNVIGGLFEVILPSKQMSFNHLTIARKNSFDETN